MPKAKLSKRIVDAAEPQAKVYLIFDDRLTGFGLKVMPSGQKAYFVEYRFGSGRSAPKRRITIGSAGKVTVEQARDLAEKALAKVALGEDPAEERSTRRKMETLAEVAESYLTDHVEKKLKPTTGAQYKWILNKFVIPDLGSKKIGLITRADVKRLHQKVGAERQITANRMLQILGSLFTYAAECQIVEEGTYPSRGIKAFRETKKDRYLNGAELARLGEALVEAETVGLVWEPDPNGKIKHAPKAENRRVVYDRHSIAGIRLLIFTGCRLREILNARWADYDAERGLLHIRDSKTGRKTVPLSAPALEILEGLERRGEFIVAGHDPAAPRWDLNRPWLAVRRRAGLEDVRIHDLRHSFASAGAGAGLGLPLIGRLLGHASVQSTARYAHLDVDPTRVAANRIGALIAAAMRGTEDRASDGQDEADRPSEPKTFPQGARLISLVRKK